MAPVTPEQARLEAVQTARFRRARDAGLVQLHTKKSPQARVRREEKMAAVDAMLAAGDLVKRELTDDDLARLEAERAVRDRRFVPSPSDQRIGLDRKAM